MIDLDALAGLIRVRNTVEAELARIIGRPAHSGHIAEFVASVIFDIELHKNASQKATDGHFRSGPLQGKLVNIKYGSRRDGLLNLVSSLEVKDHPEIYLVMTGPDWSAGSSNGLAAPWVIDQVFVFEREPLVALFLPKGKAPGVATSLKKAV